MKNHTKRKCTCDEQKVRYNVIFSLVYGLFYFGNEADNGTWRFTVYQSDYVREYGVNIWTRKEIRELRVSLNTDWGKT